MLAKRDVAAFVFEPVACNLGVMVPTQGFVDRLRARGLNVSTGVFQAMMEVELVNDGPVTMLLDSKSR